MADETMIGPYKIIEQIGSGGMATVYKAHQAKLDRFVAVKMMHQTMLDDPNFSVRFEREARIVARLDHPNIVPIYDYDDYNGVPYLVMKFLEGSTLKDFIHQKMPSLETIQRIMNAVADALTYAHREGVLHRDIKPSNIVIDHEGTPYLTDFGLARIAQQGESTLSADVMLGTPHYISPEQARGDANLTAETDIYSLGVILYELVTGRVPFTADTAFAIVHKHIYSPPPPPSELNPEVPKTVEVVLLRVLSKVPSERYETPNALMAAFNRAVADAGLVALDDSRAIIASQRGHGMRESDAAASTPPSVRTPPQIPMTGKYVMIPAPGSVNVPRPDDIIQLVGNRVRDAFWDVKEELNRRLSGVEMVQDIQASIKSAISSDPDLKRQREREKALKLIEQDWGTDEDSIRARVRKRVNRKRGLAIHTLVYGVVIVGVMRGQAEWQAQMLPLLTPPSELISNPDLTYLTPLADLKFAWFLALTWGGGLLGHALSVFYNTGSRLEYRRDALLTGLEEYYGPDWIETIEAKDYKRFRGNIEGRFNRRIGLLSHTLGAVMAILAVYLIWPPINEVINSAMLAGDLVISEPWTELFVSSTTIPAIFALLQAIGIVIRFVVLLISDLVGHDAQQRALQKEIARERERSLMMNRKRDKGKHSMDDLLDAQQGVRLTGDGEFTESFIEEMNEVGDDQQYR